MPAVPRCDAEPIQLSTGVPGAKIAASAWRPLFPEAADQGDPYVLKIPEGVRAARRYYAYCSGTGNRDGEDRAFPVYASDDLLTWTRVPQNALVGDLSKAYWAPCVRYVAGLERPYVMLFSHSVGLGEAAHIGHQIRRADAKAPEGPYEESGEVLTPGFDFAIDPDVFRAPDGRLMMAFAADFVDDLPYGTGLWIAEVGEDLRTLGGPPKKLARASADWQVYESSRVMHWKNIPGIDWSCDKVRWHCLEGPSGGLRAPDGSDVILYSGGCFYNFYAVGAVARSPDGRYRDLSADGEHFVLHAAPERGVHGPGHCSVTQAPDGSPVIVFHARFGSPDAPRQMAIAPLFWGPKGAPLAPPSTRSD